MTPASSANRPFNPAFETAPQRGKMTFRARCGSDGLIVDYQLIELSGSSPENLSLAEGELLESFRHQLVTPEDWLFLSKQFSLVIDCNRAVRFSIDCCFSPTETPDKFDFLVSKIDRGVSVHFEKITPPPRLSQPSNWQSRLMDTVFKGSEAVHRVDDESEQRLVLQQVLEHTQAGLVFARPIRNPEHQIIDFQYLLTNAYNARITGRSVAEMTGSLVSSLFPAWQQSSLFRRYVDVVETGKEQHVTFQYDDFGIKGWFDGRFCRIDGCIHYTYTDVTALKEAEMAQQQHAALLEQVMNTTPASIVVHQSIRDETGEIIDFRMVQLNQVAADLLNHPIDAIQHRRISKFFPGLLNTPLFRQYKQVVETGKPARLDVPWGKRWYDFSVARFGDGIVVAVQDNTEIRTYRHQLEQANLDLKRSNESLESFAYIASHDLQEPLRKLSSFADILHNQYAGQFDSDATDIIERINTSAVRMRSLIQDILAYARLGTHKESFKPVNLTTLIRELESDELWAAIYQTKAELTLIDLPTIIADPTQMRQLFQNLLSNAIKFCPTTTKPSISVTCQEVSQTDIPVEVRIGSSFEGWETGDRLYYVISVIDNGIGFDEKHIDRIFQVFQRLNVRNRYEGSGIGLAICYKIVERHNGAIAASSKPGSGSTFRVYLPVRSIK